MEGRKSVRRLPVLQSRSLLMMLVGGGAFGLLLAVAPLVKDRLPAQPVAGERATPAPAGELGAAELGAAELGAAALGTADRGVAAPRGAAPGGSSTQWSAVAASDGSTMRRAEQLALARDELLAREFRLAEGAAALGGRGFSWRRQAMVALGTVVLALTAVSLALKLGLGWSTWSRRLRAEESRLRTLQLSVLGALEELQATLATAQAEAERAGTMAAPPAARETGGVHAPSLSGHDAELVESLDSGRAVEPTERGEPIENSAYRDLGDRSEGARLAEGAVRGAVTPPPASWAARLLGDDQAAEAAPPRPRRPLEGPWQEPVHRRAPPRQPPAGSTAPWVSQLSDLVAQGLTIPQMARRLQVSREEVTLALAVHERRTPVPVVTERSREKEGDREA